MRTHQSHERTLQRFGLQDLRDAYHHLEQWRHPDEPKPEDLEDWSERSDDVALHAKQAGDLAKAAYEHLADEAIRRGDSRALSEAHEASERLEKAAGLLETGERMFKYSVKTLTVIQQCDEILEAARILRDADLGDVHNQQRAAEALDKLAGGFGKLGSEVLPASPAKGYFDFLGQFSGARFFAHWAEFIRTYAGKLDQASRSD